MRKTFLIFLLLSFGLLHADPLPDPDIQESSLSEYVSIDPLMWKILGSTYISALLDETERLAFEILFELKAVPEVAELFTASHESFIAFADAQAAFSEEVQWASTSTGETSWGSGHGDTTISIFATLYWERILYYRELLEEIRSSDFPVSVYPILPGAEVGGY